MSSFKYTEEVYSIFIETLAVPLSDSFDFNLKLFSHLVALSPKSRNQYASKLEDTNYDITQKYLIDKLNKEYITEEEKQELMCLQIMSE